MVSPWQWWRARASKTNHVKVDGMDSIQKTPRTAVVIVSLAVVAIFALSLWYFVQPQPLLVQGEADATRIDISARVDGRVAQRPVDRGQNVSAGQILVTIDNPELLTKLKEAQAAQAVALADFKRIEVGTRAEVIAQRKAAVASTEASERLAQQTYDRTKQLTARDFASVQKLDEATASLDVARRSQQEAKLAYEEAVAGYTVEERGVAKANVVKADAAIATLEGPGRGTGGQGAAGGAGLSHQRRSPGEYVSPGVPLLSLIDLSDVWLRFDLREDLVKGLEDRRPLRSAGAGAGRQAHHRRHPQDRHARRICRLARHARDRRLRPQDLRMSAPIPSTPCPSCGPA